jgi:adenylosuccinate synthase
MPSLSVFGAQWGDEGKGKIIDLLSADVDCVVRYQGGANAGHTVIAGGEKYVLHLIPSGILHAGRVNMIASGLAVDPIALLEEIEGLRERGVKVDSSNLRLSGSAHVIFEHHRKLDGLSEVWLGDGRIGTTGRGIGPCYADKAARTGLRIADLLETDRCHTRLRAALAEKNAVMEHVHHSDTLDLDTQLERYIALGEKLRPFVADVGQEVRDAYKAGKQVLFEGAQGFLLDMDHGTYPYVTSSNTGANGIPAGVGFPASGIDRVVGIAKAYCTRVGEGPFPSEDHGDEGQMIRDAGHEYGATTGRPRRCGWFDALAMRYSMELNGADGFVMTNLDVLTDFPELRCAVAYELGDERLERYPAGRDLAGLKPVYESMPGWTEDITGVRKYEDLPQAARNYVEWIEGKVGVKILMLSVGPDREQVIPRGL